MLLVCKIFSTFAQVSQVIYVEMNIFTIISLPSRGTEQACPVNLRYLNTFVDENGDNIGK
jgi:hypothetical protein